MMRSLLIFLRWILRDSGGTVILHQPDAVFPLDHTSRRLLARRTAAVSIWAGLLVLALFLWHLRSEGAQTGVPSESIAVILAAFTGLVSLFAWMLFRPARGVSAETPTLLLAGMAALFPPCVIALCIVPPESSLAGWPAGILFLLLVVSLMSPIPEEFFGVPRSRHSYREALTMIDLSADSLIDASPDWLASPQVTQNVPDTDRPSLAPRAWQVEDLLTDERPERGSGRGWRRQRRQRPSEATASGDEKGRRDSERPLPFRLFRGSRLRPDRKDRPAEGVDRPPRMPAVVGTRSVRADSGPATQQSAASGMPAAAPSAAAGGAGVLPSVDRVRGDIQVVSEQQQARFERVQDDMGGEMVEGIVVMHFEPGQKRANVHIPFSPPLTSSPDVESHPIDHDQLRVKVPERRPWGIRIEGRRSDADAAEDVQVAFSAICVSR